MSLELITKSLDTIERGLEASAERQRELADRVLGLEQRNSGADIAVFEAAGKDQPAVKWITPADGREVRVLSRGQRFADAVGREGPMGELVKSGLRLGDFARAIVVGARSDLEKKAMSIGTATAGGHLVPAPLAGDVIDLMRAQSVVERAGASTIPMESATLKIARVTADPTLEWLAENAEQTASDPSFDAVTLTSKTLRCLVRASREVVEDAPNFASVFEEMLGRAFAAEVDRVALVGSGSGAEPLGLFGTSGIGSVSMGTNGAALTNFDPLVDVLTTLGNANAPMPTAFIYAPRTAGAFGKLKATDNQPLQAPAEVAAIPRLVTANVPVNQTQGTANNASCILSGFFSDLLVGVRTQLNIEANTWTNVANYQVTWIASLRVDVQVARPSAFCRVVGIIP